MGIAWNRTIEQTVREVGELKLIVKILSDSLAQLEERVKVLENGDRQRSADGGNRRRKEQ